MLTSTQKLSELTKEFENYLDENVQLCRIEGDFIVFQNGHYDIPLDECSNYEQILQWTLHLSRKIWVNNRIIERFIVLACEFHNISHLLRRE